MRKMLAVSILLLTISVPMFAGETGSPGGADPTPTPTPTPCTGFCPDDPGTSSATASSAPSDADDSDFLTWLYELMFGA